MITIYLCGNSYSRRFAGEGGENYRRQCSLSRREVTECKSRLHCSDSATGDAGLKTKGGGSGVKEDRRGRGELCWSLMRTVKLSAMRLGGGVNTKNHELVEGG